MDKIKKNILDTYPQIRTKLSIIKNYGTEIYS